MTKIRKGSSKKALKTQKTDVKSPHENKIPQGGKQTFIQTVFSHSQVKNHDFKNKIVQFIDFK